MASSSSDPIPYAAESFWEMLTLSLGGMLASCESCVEHYYLQSTSNARMFLDAWARSGMVERMSLLDLLNLVSQNAHGYKDRSIEKYDQPVFVPPPSYRQDRPKAERRMEQTARAVYEAYNIYCDRLNRNDVLIELSFDRALEAGKFRHSASVMARRDVKMTPIARLRLILDGFKAAANSKNQSTDEVIGEAVAFVLQGEGISGTYAVRTADNERGDELKEFLLCFFQEERDLRGYWQESKWGPPPLDRMQDYRNICLNAVLDLSRAFYERERRISSSRAIAFAEQLANVLEDQIRRGNLAAISSHAHMLSTPAYWRVLAMVGHDLTARLSGDSSEADPAGTLLSAQHSNRGAHHAIGMYSRQSKTKGEYRISLWGKYKVFLAEIQLDRFLRDHPNKYADLLERYRQGQRLERASKYFNRAVEGRLERLAKQ